MGGLDCVGVVLEVYGIAAEQVRRDAMRFAAIISMSCAENSNNISGESLQPGCARAT